MPPPRSVRGGGDGRSEVLTGFLLVVESPPSSCDRLTLPRGAHTPPVHLDRLVPMDWRVKCTGGVWAPRGSVSLSQLEGGLSMTKRKPVSTSDLPSPPPRTLRGGGMPAAVT